MAEADRAPAAHAVHRIRHLLVWEVGDQRVLARATRLDAMARAVLVAAATCLDDRHKMTDGVPLKRHAGASMLDGMTTTTATTPTGAEPTHHVFHPDPAKVRRAIERRSVATLATVSGKGRPHAATVLYQCVDDALFVSTHRDSRKARNVAANRAAAMTIAVRRLPIGPPASIQFQSSAAVLTNDDPEIVRLAAAGRLDRITAHGEMDIDGGCFLRLALPARVVSYALGMSLWRVIRNPLDAAGEVDLRTTPRSNDPG
jgi:uncharacterized protein YhbP (UPF0306 family)